MRVTGILSACGLRQWPACIPQHQREFYLNRGCQIHKVTELHDLGTLDESSVDPRITGFLAGYKSFREIVGGEMRGIEKEVKHKTLGYCGRLDRIIGPSAVCQYPCVLDIKTNDADIFTRLQLSGYRMALPCNKNMRRMAVSLFDDGKFKTQVYDSDTTDDKTWLACYQLAVWMERNKAEINNTENDK